MAPEVARTLATVITTLMRVTHRLPSAASWASIWLGTGSLRSHRGRPGCYARLVDLGQLATDAKVAFGGSVKAARDLDALGF